MLVAPALLQGRAASMLTRGGCPRSGRPARGSEPQNSAAYSSRGGRLSAQRTLRDPRSWHDATLAAGATIAGSRPVRSSRPHAPMRCPDDGGCDRHVTTGSPSAQPPCQPVLRATSGRARREAPGAPRAPRHDPAPLGRGQFASGAVGWWSRKWRARYVERATPQSCCRPGDHSRATLVTALASPQAVRGSTSVRPRARSSGLAICSGVKYQLCTLRATRGRTRSCRTQRIT
jgi:hypothetical protein